MAKVFSPLHLPSSSLFPHPPLPPPLSPILLYLFPSSSSSSIPSSPSVNFISREPWPLCPLPHRQLSMNHTAPLPALNEQSTNLEKSDLTQAGKFPTNSKGKCWSCEGTPGAGDRRGVEGRTEVSLDLPCSGKGDSDVGDSCRCQDLSGNYSFWALYWHCEPSLGSQGAASCLG